MFPNTAVMRRSVGCAGRPFARVVVSWLLLWPGLPAHAQDAQQTAPAQPVELPVISVTVPPPSKPTNQGAGNSVVVSPTTVPTPADQSASSVTVITGADIESQQWRTIPDALMAVPGLNVVQAGGPGGLTSVFIRGTNSNHVKVLIDGVDVSDPSNPTQTFDFGQLLTGDIARIEILRGPQSGLYGSDAIGGVISITTKNGEGPPKVIATVEGGSFGTFNQRAGLSGSQDNFNYVFNVQHFSSTQTPVTPLNELAPGEHRNNDTYDNWTYSTKLGASRPTISLSISSAGIQIRAWIHRRRLRGFLSARAGSAAEHAGGSSILRARRSGLVAIRWPVQEFLRRELYEFKELEPEPKTGQLQRAARGRPADHQFRAAHPV